MVCTSIGAAQGWVAIGFGDDRAMGRDAVLMATASTLTSRWNEGMPKQSIKTEEIGVKNATVQGHNSVVSRDFTTLHSISNPKVSITDQLIL